MDKKEQILNAEREEAEVSALPINFPISGYGPESELTPGDVLRKVIDLEISEKERIDRFKSAARKVKPDAINAMISAFPTRDFAHANTSPVDEFSIMNDYEIALQLMNLNSHVFAKAAMFFYLRASGKLALTKSRDMAFIKELKTSWAGTRQREDPETWQYPTRKK